MIQNNLQYQNDVLYLDSINLSELVTQVQTPFYLYSTPQILANIARIRAAFQQLNSHIHYSIKANNNRDVLKIMHQSDIGFDAVSGGEIYAALQAGAQPTDIVFAGVGKSPDEIAYAVEQNIAWFNVENVHECDLINEHAQQHNRQINIALRLNPEISANTHPNIATGHGKAKFGLTESVINEILSHQNQYSNLVFKGIHVHIGSQLGDVERTVEAAEHVVELAKKYPSIDTINIGGGFPVNYHVQVDSPYPAVDDFARSLKPVLDGYQLLLEPGRSIIADAGILISKVLYVKEQAGQKFIVIDASMTELMRPALYDAYHEFIPLTLKNDQPTETVTIVGPVCETTDVFAVNRDMKQVNVGDCVAILTCGAYGAVMANNYNMRVKPAEVIIDATGQQWKISRKRQTWQELIE